MIETCEAFREAARDGRPVIESAPDSVAARQIEELAAWLEEHGPRDQRPPCPATHADAGGSDQGGRSSPFVGAQPPLAPVGLGGTGDLKAGEAVAGEMLGVYGELAYDVLPQLFPDTEKSFEPFFRYEYYDTQRNLPSGFSKNESKEIEIYTFGVSFKPIPNVVIKADYRNRKAKSGELPDEFNMGVGFVF